MVRVTTNSVNPPTARSFPVNPYLALPCHNLVFFQVLTYSVSTCTLFVDLQKAVMLWQATADLSFLPSMTRMEAGPGYGKSTR